MKEINQLSKWKSPRFGLPLLPKKDPRPRASSAIAIAGLLALLLSSSAGLAATKVDQAAALIEQAEKTLDLKALDRGRKILEAECKGPNRDPYCEYYLARIHLALYSYYSQVKPDRERAERELNAAEKTAKSAVVRRPNDARVRALMGKVYQVKLSRMSLAELTLTLASSSPVVEEYQKALALDPNCGEAELGLGIYYLYIPRVFGGDAHRARTHFKRAIELMPDRPEPLVWMSISLREEGRLEKARTYMNRALALAPDNSFVQAENARLSAAEKRAGKP